MVPLKQLVAEHEALWAQYKTFPRDWFRKPGETEPPFSPYRHPDLVAHDKRIGAKAEEIRNHPDYRDMEPDLIEVLGDRIRNSADIAQKAYSSLCNVDWEHEKGSTYGCSWRYAGGLIADIHNGGDYLDWYCSGHEGEVAPEIEEAMATKGWKPREMD